MSIAYSFYLNYSRESNISMGNLFCWLISKLLNPYIGQLAVYKPRATTSVNN